MSHPARGHTIGQKTIYHVCVTIGAKTIERQSQNIHCLSGNDCKGSATYTATSHYFSNLKNLAPQADWWKDRFRNGFCILFTKFKICRHSKLGSIPEFYVELYFADENTKILQPVEKTYTNKKKYQTICFKLFNPLIGFKHKLFENSESKF